MRGLLLVAAFAACAPRTALDEPGGGDAPWLVTGSSCTTCHDRLTTPRGEDISIGSQWQASLMANSARDPYWQAAVRREIVDHPAARADIEDECGRCHMPMANERARAAGDKGQVFAKLGDPLAIDGVACSLCHQIGAANLGTRASYSGGFQIARQGWPTMFGPFDVEPSQTSIMRSALGVVPARGDHVVKSELCATCHTLYTRGLDAAGHALAPFPEQVPYLEWQASDLRAQKTCQDCHMPAVAEPVAISSVAPALHTGMARHDFRGANFLGLAMLARHRDELGVIASDAALANARTTTERTLATETARVALAVSRQGARLIADVDVTNLTGHKLPTAYPSRRVWLHLVVRGADGAARFESGRLRDDGSIEGNDNDLDPQAFEPHHDLIERADEVQIYEPILGDANGRVTTALLSATTYLKDNRLLPRGFAKQRAPADIAVHGAAQGDESFVGGGDRVRYAVDAGEGPVTVDVELLYQPVGFRWANNFAPYDAPEPKRFVRYYAELAPSSARALARDSARIP